MLKEGQELIIPFNPNHHLKNTGVLCKISRIHDVNVEVKKFNPSKNCFNSYSHRVDRIFLEKYVNNS